MQTLCSVITFLLVTLTTEHALAKNDFNSAYGGPTASDQVSQIYIPKFKIQFGSDGAATDVSASNPLPVAATFTMPPLVNYALEAGGHLESIDSKLTSPFTVYQGSAPWSVSQSGVWSVGRTWTLASGTDSVASIQSGTWSTGRTWTLGFAADSVTDRLQDGSGNPITSQVSGSQRALDVGINVGGAQVDPRSRTWSLSSGSDSVASVQSGAWTTGRTWSLLNSTDSVNAVQSGSWTVAGSGNFTVVQPTGSNLHATIDNFPATQAVTQSTSPWVVSGTVTANAGTNLNTSALQLDTTGAKLNLAQASTTSGQTGPLIQGAVTTAAPTYTTATTQPLSLTLAGGLRTDSSGTTQPVSGTVTANQGGVWSTGRTWSLLNSTDSVNAVQSGTWTVQQGTPPWSVSQSGAWTTGRTWSLASGTDSVASVQSGAWTTGRTWALASGTDTATVVQPTGSNLHVQTDSGSTTAVTQATASSLNAQVVGNAATAATDSGNPVKIGSIFNTTQPTVTNGQRVDAQGTPRGAVIVNPGVETFNVQANAGTNLNTSALALSATQTNGTQKTQVVDGAGAVVGPVMANSGVNHAPVYLPLDVIQTTQNITTQDLATATTTGYGGQSFIIGNPTSGSAAALALNSVQTVMAEVKGIWTGTLAIEVSSDGGTTWVPRGIHVVGTAIFSASVTSNVVGSLNGSAKTNVRVRATSAITGTALVSFLVSDNPSNMYVANPVKLVDGSSTTSTTQMAIKAASTAAVATDTAVVVALNPGTALNLPTNAAQETGGHLAAIDTDIDIGLSTRASLANQTNGTQKSQVVDASGNVAPAGDIAARAAFMAITDTTNTATVKAASTAAVATDKALVVAISPNNTITTSTSAGSSGTPTQTSVSCAATTTTLLAAAAATKFISIRNPTTSTVTIWINVAGAAAVAAAPSIDLAPGSEADYYASETSFLPTAQINCISSGTASSVTLVYK